MFLIDSSRIPANTRVELINEKIARPSQVPRISRTRLLGLLEKSMESCTSTVISGRAGTGKSALALDFSRVCGRRVAWYKVDAPEADPKIFFYYLIRSIQQQRPAFGTKALTALIDVAQHDRVDGLAEAFVYEFAENEAKPLLIVIEDLHLICDADWLVPFFRRLLPLLPSEVHVLITSRTLPPAPLWRMRSKQTLMVIEEETLAFNPAEAVALFESYGLSTEQANIALDHTHGRAAALDGVAALLRKPESDAKASRLKAEGNGHSYSGLSL